MRIDTAVVHKLRRVYLNVWITILLWVYGSLVARRHTSRVDFLDRHIDHVSVLRCG